MDLAAKETVEVSWGKGEFVLVEADFWAVFRKVDVDIAYIIVNCWDCGRVFFGCAFAGIVAWWLRDFELDALELASWGCGGATDDRKGGSAFESLERA